MGGTIMTIEQINSYCYENYEEGGDIVVETMDEKEKLGKFESLESLQEWIEVQHEHRLEIQATAW